jgi:poly(3-hydroxybutyrate) depolymerase
MRLILPVFACALLLACGPPTSSDGNGDRADAGNSLVDAGGSPVVVPDRPVATGNCPTFSAGTNVINPSGQNRQVDVYLPTTTDNAPVLFIWHGLGGNPSNMARSFGAQGIAGRHDAIVVVPHSSGQFANSEWSFSGDSTVDAVLFEETISCLDAQFGIDRGRVYTTGFSAGALWSTWLLMNRSQYLASAALFSGGVMGGAYTAPQFDLPVLAIHGGATDVFGGFLRFNDITIALTNSLKGDGHFVVLCNHDSGHTIPFSPTAFAIPFLFDHRFGDASSPHSSGLASNWPEFCAIH